MKNKKGIKQIIQIFVMIVTFIPMVMIELFYQITYILHLELIYFIAKVCSWAGDYKGAFEYLNILTGSKKEWGD